MSELSVGDRVKIVEDIRPWHSGYSHFAGKEGIVKSIDIENDCVIYEIDIGNDCLYFHRDELRKNNSNLTDKFNDLPKLYFKQPAEKGRVVEFEYTHIVSDGEEGKLVLIKNGVIFGEHLREDLLTLQEAKEIAIKHYKDEINKIKEIE